GMTVDEQTGVIYLADFGNHAVRRIYPSGWVETVAGGPDQKLFNYPRSVAFGRLPSVQNPDGDPALMVTDTENDRLGLINLTDNSIAFLDGVVVSRPKSVDWFYNFIAVADENRIQLLKVNGDGLTVSTIAEGIKANSVFFDLGKHLYLTTQNSNKIQVI